MNSTVLNSLLKGQSELICHFDSNLILTYVNDTYYRFFNIKQEDLIGKSFLQFIPIDEHLVVKNRLFNLTPTSSSVTYRHEVILPDGQIGWQEWTDNAIFDENGTLDSFQSIGHDVTENVALKCQLDFIYNFMQTISKTSNLENLFKTLSNHILTLHEIDGAGIYIEDKINNTLTLDYYTGLSDEFAQRMKIITPESELYKSIKTEKPVYVEFWHLYLPIIEELKNEGIKALAILPLKHNSVSNISLLFHSRNFNKFPDIIKTTLEIIAMTISSTISNISNSGNIK